MVVAPPGALERVVSNLLDNAAKFGPAGEVIEVRVSGGRVAVRDRGPGLSDLPIVGPLFGPPHGD